VIIYK